MSEDQRDILDEDYLDHHHAQNSGGTTRNEKVYRSLVSAAAQAVKADKKHQKVKNDGDLGLNLPGALHQKNQIVPPFCSM